MADKKSERNKTQAKADPKKQPSAAPGIAFPDLPIDPEALPEGNFLGQESSWSTALEQEREREEIINQDQL